MENIMIIFITTFIVFIFLRMVGIGLNCLINKVFKNKDDRPSEYGIWFSICWYFVFLSILISAIEQMDDKFSNNFEWYTVFTSIGIMSVLWCYYQWEFSFRALPKLIDKNTNAQKKAIVFGCTLLFSIYFGYQQILQLINGITVDSLYVITNVTIISSITAFDRFMNQVYYLKTK